MHKKIINKTKLGPLKAKGEARTRIGVGLRLARTPVAVDKRDHCSQNPKIAKVLFTVIWSREAELAAVVKEYIS